MSKNQETTSSYVELASQAYALGVEAFAAANKRLLDYNKSIYEIASRPYASSAAETAVRENFDRLNQIVSLTVGELQAAGTQQAEFVRKATSHAAKMQETLAHAWRGALETGISNVNFVKETTGKQLDELTQRLDEIQTRTAQTISQN